MQEVVLEEQLKNQLHIQDPAAIVQPRERRERRGKVRNTPSTTKTNLPIESLTLEDSIKSEIEFMPMKTPISILQELLSRRGMFSQCFCDNQVFNVVNLIFRRDYSKL